ncbi:hypothetical protein KCU67_g117, partial [Aureobasidium melanogenum]
LLSTSALLFGDVSCILVSRLVLFEKFQASYQPEGWAGSDRHLILDLMSHYLSGLAAHSLICAGAASSALL